MAIGRTFEEALQKATRMLEIGVVRRRRQPDGYAFDDLRARAPPTDRRAASSRVAEALQERLVRSTGSIELTKIDRWFLHQDREYRRGRAASPRHGRPGRASRGTCSSSAKRHGLFGQADRPS
ncbi:MAG: hypothetical protein M0C28_32145 [Candidatus Moduliflexus flocculans]|nr:hypothetical protein [Candidatus Moduliflexus flocculans]